MEADAHCGYFVSVFSFEGNCICKYSEGGAWLAPSESHSSAVLTRHLLFISEVEANRLLLNFWYVFFVANKVQGDGNHRR